MQFFRDLGRAKECAATESDEGIASEIRFNVNSRPPMPAYKEEMIAPFFCQPSDGVFFSSQIPDYIIFFLITTLEVIVCLNIFKYDQTTMYPLYRFLLQLVLFTYIYITILTINLSQM